MQLCCIWLHVTAERRFHHRFSGTVPWRACLHDRGLLPEDGTRESTGDAWFTQVCEETFNYVIVEIDGNDLECTAYREDGSVLDSFEIHK